LEQQSDHATGGYATVWYGMDWFGMVYEKVGMQERARGKYTQTVVLLSSGMKLNCEKEKRPPSYFIF
jgi:hypothetical protein